MRLKPLGNNIGRVFINVKGKMISTKENKEKYDVKYYLKILDILCFSRSFIYFYDIFYGNIIQHNILIFL